MEGPCVRFGFSNNLGPSFFKLAFYNTNSISSLDIVRQSTRLICHSRAGGNPRGMDSCFRRNDKNNAEI